MGELISIEGIDGAGKSTLAHALTSALRRHGCDAVLVRKKQLEGYPAGFVSRWATLLSALLWEATPEDPVAAIPEESWMQLHALWYRTMQEHLLAPLLERHACVVLDGWYYKCLARHRVHGEHDPLATQKLFSHIREPDRVVLLDVPAELCWTRRAAFRPSELGAHGGGISGSARDRFVHYQGRVREQYRNLTAGPHWWVIEPGTASAEAISADLAARLRRG